MAEENFARKLAESNQNLSLVIASQEEQHYLGKKKGEEKEIGVFSAEKYFNGAMDDSPRLPKVVTRKYKYIKDEQIKVAPVKTKIQPGIPSVRSESSWNSQSALLQSALRNSLRQRVNKVQGKSFFTGLRCKCYCSDKDSVDINELTTEASFRKTANSSLDQGKAITKEPIKPSYVIDTLHIDKSLAKEEEGEEIKPRKSLEVFGCPTEKRNKSSGVERRLSMLSQDTAPRHEEIEFSATPGESYNDALSDASSDLFEIESLAGKAIPSLARQGSNATSDCATQTACYAPSEASIEWSVVTASAADYSEELRSPTTATSPVRSFSATSNARTATITEIPKQHPSISLGCKSIKTVRVAGEAYRTNEKANSDPLIHHMSESFTPVTRFQAEAELTASIPGRGNMLLLPPAHYPYHTNHIQ